MKTNGQVQRLKEWFDAGRSITRLQSFLELGIMELSSRAGELEEAGYKLDRVRIKVLNRFQEKVSVMQYKRAR